MNSRSVLGIAGGLLAGLALGWLLFASPSSHGAGAPTASDADDPSAALEAILAMPSPRERARALVDLLDRSHPSAGLLVHEKLLELRAAPGMDEIVEILVADWWAQAAPQVAFAHPIDPPWPDRHPWARTVLRTWARRDPVAAAIAVQQMPAGPNSGRISAARTVVDAWLELEEMPDPTPLLGVLSPLEPMARGAALHHVAKTLIENHGVDEALAIIRSVPDDRTPGGSVQQELFARTGVALLDVDPERATAWAAELADTPAGPGVLKHIAYYWALRDGRPALEWALGLPDSPAKNTVVKRAWISYSRKHLDDAKAWLSEHPPHPRMKATYREYLRTMGESDREAAFAIADRAEDPEYRDDLRAAVAEGWMKVDPDAAGAWLAEAGLPPALAARVRAAAGESRVPRAG